MLEVSKLTLHSNLEKIFQILLFFHRLEFKSSIFCLYFYIFLNFFSVVIDFLILLELKLKYKLQ
jgi:hypothetical protein